ncbi:glycosyltransferase [Haloferax prahovense]|uniref:glycosyltransferase n=1 Tax=Haloferax prahovense TaxID=381852 RepID=UPI003C75F410
MSSLVGNNGGLNRLKQNLKFMVNIFSSESYSPLILGIEPFDPRMVLFNRLTDLHPCIYHTSWPYWTGDYVPIEAKSNLQTTVWDRFLQSVKVVTVTQSAADSLTDRGVHATHIPHGVDTDVYHPQRGDNYDSDTAHVLFVGRLEKRKGVDTLIKLIQNAEFINTCFHFVGEGPLEQQISKLSTSENVEYHGYVSDERKLAKIYSSSDLLVLPSRRSGDWEELFGIVLIEAMSSGIPVISTDCVGPREIISDGETGFIVNQDKPIELQDRINKLISDSSLRQKMGKKAREKAVEKYDIVKVANEWKCVIDQTTR